MKQRQRNMMNITVGTENLTNLTAFLFIHHKIKTIKLDNHKLRITGEFSKDGDMLGLEAGFYYFSLTCGSAP